MNSTPAEKSALLILKTLALKEYDVIAMIKNNIITQYRICNNRFADSLGYIENSLLRSIFLMHYLIIILSTKGICHIFHKTLFRSKPPVHAHVYVA